MKLVTFRIDRKRNLVMQFPVFIQPYAQLILYQLETVPVSMVDKNTNANSYTELNTKLVMYFTINIAFTNYINEFDLMDELESPILTNKTIFEYTLPVFLNQMTFDDTLLSAPLILKGYINQYKHDSENFDLKERYDIDELGVEFANKNFFTNNFIVDIFVFVIAIITVITTIIIIYTLCNHNKLRALVTSLALQQVTDIKAEEIRNGNYKHECTSQLYIILASTIAIIGLVVFAILQVRRIKLCRGQLFSNVVKIMFFSYQTYNIMYW